MNLKILIFVLCVFYADKVISEDCPAGPKILCYYSSWAFYRPEIGFFNTEKINTTLCTHIIYSFVGLDVDLKINSIDYNVDVTLGGLRNFTDLKVKNPCLKTILAVGGWNEGSRKYSVMVSEPESRKVFVESALRFLVTYNFDGLDLDWEYPGQRGGISEDKGSFVELLKLLHSRLSKWNLEISIAAPIIESFLNDGYDVQEISKYVSHVSLMAYDYTATTSKTTGLMAPFSQIKSSVNLWITRGLPKSKLILGLPSYARTYTLKNSGDYSIGAPTNGTGRNGQFTNEPGFLSYYELQRLLQTNLYTIKREDDNCYAYYKLDWFSFDDTQSYSKKIDYVINEKLGGIMLWTIDTDDFNGEYGKNYTLLNTIYDKLRNKKLLQF